MIAVINTLLFIISIAWFLVIASAIFSWLYAFNVINANNQVIATIGRSLYQLTEPVYRPIRKIMPDFGALDLTPMVVLLIVFFLRSNVLPAVFGALIGQ